VQAATNIGGGGMLEPLLPYAGDLDSALPLIFAPFWTEMLSEAEENASALAAGDTSACDFCACGPACAAMLDGLGGLGATASLASALAAAAQNAALRKHRHELLHDQAHLDATHARQGYHSLKRSAAEPGSAHARSHSHAGAGNDTLSLSGQSARLHAPLAPGAHAHAHAHAHAKQHHVTLPSPLGPAPSRHLFGAYELGAAAPGMHVDPATPRLPCDIAETAGAFFLRFDVSGCAREQVTLDFGARSRDLRVTAHRKTGKVEAEAEAALGWKQTHVERATGSTTRRVVLPPSADMATARAKLADGMVYVRVDKRADAASVARAVTVA